MENFIFLNMPNGHSLDEISTIVTHGYNSAEGQFEVDSENTHIARIRKKFDDLYVRNMMGELPQPIFPFDGDRLENKVANHVFSSGSTQLKRKKSSINRVLSKVLAFAPSVDFTVPGSIHRQPGRFIILFDSTVQTGSAFEKILHGEWFTVKVIHYFNFSALKYNQQVVSTKSHSYTNLAPNNDDDIAIITQ